MPVPHGLMFHHFINDGESAVQGEITADELAAMIEFVGAKHILPAKVWLDRAISRRLSDADICITFDDALLCQYEIAKPVLESFDLTAFWFVYSSVFEGMIEQMELYRHFRTRSFDGVDAFYEAFWSHIEATPYKELVDRERKQFVPANYLQNHAFYSDQDREFRFVRDRVLGAENYQIVMDDMMDRAGFNPQQFAAGLWMNNDHLIELQKNSNVIGLHSYSHPTALADMPSSGQRNEYQKNIDHLEKLLGQRPNSMSHPCNSYTDETLDTLTSMGVEIGFCSSMKGSGASDLEFPREDHINIKRDMLK